jgi:sarcosine oxidase subunit beta
MKSYDVIVVGGGMMGTACAYYLTQEGLKVAIVERGDIAGGTVSHTDGYIGASEKEPGVDSMQGAESMKLYEEMRKTFDYDFEYSTRLDGSGDPCGFVYFCESEFEMEMAAKQVETNQSIGIEQYMVSKEEIHELEPNAATDILGGMWVPKDAAVCPYRVAFGFVEEAKKTGLLDVYTRTEVTDIKQDPNTKAVLGVVTTKGEFDSPRVVNAAGVWGPFIGAMVGLEVPIEPRFGQLLVTEKTGPISQYRLCMEYGYFLTKFFLDGGGERPISPLVKAYNVCLNFTSDLTGNTVTGGCRLFRGYSIKSEYRIMQACAQRAVRFFPVVKNYNCIRSFAGVRPFCLDQLPIVSDVPEVPGFYMACGHEGDGITLGPITGKLISQYVTGKPLQFELAPELAWSRFHGVDIAALKAKEHENTLALQAIEKEVIASLGKN